MIFKKICLISGIAVSGLLLPGLAPPQSKLLEARKSAAALEQNLSMYWIDTEGGAATLIVTPTGESVLIDTGNPGGRDAKRINEVAKNAAGLTQIDHLVTTHWHIDHYGGAAELAREMPILEVHDKGLPATLKEDARFAQNIQPYRDMAVKKRSIIKPNQKLKLKSLAKGFPDLSLRFVGVDKQFVAVSKKAAPYQYCEETPNKAEDNSDNANSLVLIMDYGPFRFFDGGDLTWNIEKNLVCPQNLIGTVDVYQVNHHGLDQSNNPVLVKSLAPTVSIMNNGTRKGCGPATVTTLRQTPSIMAAYQLHKNIRSDAHFNTADEFIANTDENCQANYVKLTVAQDGKSYTVSIPAKNHQKIFSTKTSH